eukprot:PhM_4_TR5759/c0_g1_i1/m.35089
MSVTSSLRRIPRDVLADVVLPHLGPDDLVVAEQVSKLWRYLILDSPSSSSSSLLSLSAPSPILRSLLSKCDFTSSTTTITARRLRKFMYYQRKKEIVRPQMLPIPIDEENVCVHSGVWRVVNLHQVMPYSHATHSSPVVMTFYTDEADNDDGVVPLAVHIVLQWVASEANFQENVDHSQQQEGRLGVFIRVEAPAVGRDSVGLPPFHCIYSLSLLHPETYVPLVSNSAEKTFGLRNPARVFDTSGWLFGTGPLNASSTSSPPMSYLPNEVLISFEIVTLVQSIQSMSDADKIYSTLPVLSSTAKRTFLSFVSELVMRCGNKGKALLQRHTHGVRSVLDILEECLVRIPCEDSDDVSREINSERSLIGDVLLFCAAAGVLWNALDLGPELLIPEDVKKRVVSVVSRGTRLEPSLTAPSSWQRMAPQLMTSCFGMLWNLPIDVALLKSTIARDAGLVDVLISTVQSPGLSDAHFTAVHILCSLLMHRCFLLDDDDDKRHDVASRLVWDYVATSPVWGDEVGQMGMTELGVSLSLRDLADFFLPYARSTNRAVAAYGCWAIVGYYNVSTMNVNMM